MDTRSDRVISWLGPSDGGWAFARKAGISREPLAAGQFRRSPAHAPAEPSTLGNRDMFIDMQLLLAHGPPCAEHIEPIRERP
jgi:hypothetical protein